MTSRERFLASMAYEPMDRAPLWDEGIRDDVRERWAIEGLSAGDSLADHFTYDGREEVGFDLMPQPEPSPAPDHAALLRHMRTLYEPTDDRLGDDWDARATEWNERDYVLGIRVWRGLVQPLGVGNFRTLEPAFLSFYDDPDGVAALMSAITDCNVAMCERAVRGFTPDYAVFDEPIAGAYGPVVSPALFRRFCLPHYARLVETLKARGVRWYLVRSYGNPLDLLPVWLDAGINMLWCVEGGSSGVDCVALRREYGRSARQARLGTPLSHGERSGRHGKANRAGEFCSLGQGHGKGAAEGVPGTGCIHGFYPRRRESAAHTVSHCSRLVKSAARPRRNNSHAGAPPAQRTAERWEIRSLLR